VNDGGGDGAGCFDIKEWADTTELTNVEVAGLGNWCWSGHSDTCWAGKQQPISRCAQVCL